MHEGEGKKSIETESSEVWCWRLSTDDDSLDVVLFVHCFEFFVEQILEAEKGKDRCEI